MSGLPDNWTDTGHLLSGPPDATGYYEPQTDKFVAHLGSSPAAAIPAAELRLGVEQYSMGGVAPWRRAVEQYSMGGDAMVEVTSVPVSWLGCGSRLI